MIRDARVQFSTENNSVFDHGLQAIYGRHLSRYGNGKRTVDRGDGQAVAKGFDDPFRFLPGHADGQHFAPALHVFLKPAALVNDAHTIFQGQRARDAGSGDLPDAVSDYEFRLYAEGPPPGGQGPLQPHVGGLGGLDIGDRFSWTSVEHPVAYGPARNRREQAVEPIQRLAKAWRRVVEGLSHAEPLGTHAGEDKHDRCPTLTNASCFETLR